MNPPPVDARMVDAWYGSLTDVEKINIFGEVQTKELKCVDPSKRVHLKMSWKSDLSDNTALLKYEESETGLYYECPNILEYIQDCRYRKTTATSEIIRDFELIYKNNRQKLFLWILDIHVDILEEFSNGLKEFLSSKTGKDVSLLVDIFENKYILMTNIVVNNYDQKIKLLIDFKKTLVPEMAAPIAVYLDNVPDLYEKIPSITNERYLNSVTIDLVSKGYFVDVRLIQKIKDIIASHVSDRKYITIDHHEEPTSEYAEFVEYILTTKPDWYVPDTWLPKTVLVEKFNEYNDSNILANAFMKNMNAEGLMKLISKGEKRARVNGKYRSVFLIK